MDTISHGLIGALGSRTGFSQKAGRLATVGFTVGAVFPDIDIVASFLGPDFALRYHRGITHSVIAAPFFAIFVGAIINHFSSARNFRLTVLMVALGLYSHIFFDLITSYGTVIFDPLTSTRYSWNLVFILDPFITVPVILGLVLCWKKRELARQLSFAIFGYLALYLVLCLYMREFNSDRLADFAETHSLEVIHSSVYPRPLAPFLWMGLIETEEAFYKVDLSLFDMKREDFQEVAKTKSNRYLELAKDLPATKTYLWFADFPVASYRNENGSHVVEFYDLRFSMVPDRKPFLFRVIFDRSDSVVSISLNGRSIRHRM